MQARLPLERVVDEDGIVALGAGAEQRHRRFRQLFDAAAQAACTPVYEEMPGWSESTYGARSWADLPANAVKYIRRVEELTRTPVTLLSTSPERDDTILVSDPFEG